MDKIAQIIFENSVSGKIDKQVGAELLKLLKTNKKQNDGIAIIGMSIKIPDAETAGEYWSNIINCTDSIKKMSEERKRDIEDFMLHFTSSVNPDFEYPEGGYVRDIDKFDYSFFHISPNEARYMSPEQRLFLETAWRAVEDAGYGGNKLSGSKTGIFVGYGDAPWYGQYVLKTDPVLQSLAFAGNISSIIASRLAYLMDLKGPSMLIDTACSSSLVAVHNACKSIQNGECDYAIAGGVTLNIIPVKGVLSVGIEAGDFRTRSFDDNSTGTSWGEGVAAILLKPLEKAIADNDNIYAVIKGSAINQDGSSAGLTAPNMLSQADVIVNAWKEAGINPETISYIEAHGSGTKLGDTIEIEAIKRAFSRYTSKRQFCALGSVKTNIGHLGGTSGIAGLIKAVLALKNGELPPMINLVFPNREIDFVDSPVYLSNRLEDWTTEGVARRCGVSSFGLSGTNCHVVLEEAVRKDTETSANTGPFIFTLSAKSENSLKQLVKKYKDYVSRESIPNLGDVCFTASTGRAHYNYRIAFLAEDSADFIKKISGLDINDFRINCVDGEAVCCHYANFKDEGNRVLYILDGESGESLKTQIFEKAECILNGYMENKSREQLKELCKLYVTGASIDWSRLYSSGKYFRQSLPVYQFERERCWVESNKTIRNTSSGDVGFNHLYFGTEWVPSDTVPGNWGSQDGYILILKNQYEFTDDFTEKLKEKYKYVIEIALGSNYERLSDTSYIINGSRADYDKLFHDLKGKHISKIIHMLSLKSTSSADSIYELEEAVENGVMSLFHLCRTLIDNDIKNDIDVVLISDYITRVTGKEDCIKPENASLFGLGKVMGQEYGHLKCRAIDIDERTNIETVLNEISCKYQSYHVAYRNGERYIEKFKKVKLSEYDKEDIKLIENGAYVITGGTGGIGLEIAKYLSALKKINIVLIGVSKLPERHLWPDIIERGQNKKLCSKLEGIIKIEKLGSTVDYYSADVSDEIEMKTVISRIRAEYGRINGVIHSAGIAGDGFIIRKDEKVFRKVLAPKIKGTWLLDRLTIEDKPDFFIMFSSAVSIFGAPGEGDYTAANSYLDSYTWYRGDRGKTLTINWTGWKDVGMIVNMEIDTEGSKVLPTRLAVNAFGLVINRKMSRVMIGEIDYDNEIHSKFGANAIMLSDEILQDNKAKKAQSDFDTVVSQNEIILSGRENEIYSETEKRVANIWGGILGYDRICTSDNFFELGGDSIIAMKAVNSINKLTGLKIVVSDLLRNPGFTDFVRLLEESSEAETDALNKVVSIRPAEEKEYYPVSSAQKRLFILDKLDNSGLSYNIPAIMSVKGDICPAKLKVVFSEIVNRHEILRTSFESIKGTAVQRVHQDIGFTIDYEEATDDQVEALIKDFIRPFNLKEAPLLRIKLVKLAQENHILMFDIHHIISDGISMGVIVKEFVDLYKGKKLDKITLNYKDFAQWQNDMLDSEYIKKQREYWLGAFVGEIPVLGMPTDYSRPHRKTFDGNRIGFNLDFELVSGLRELSAGTNTTLFMILLAAYNILLLKYTGQEDIVVGSPVAGREQPEVESMIGMFVNTVALRNYPKYEMKFTDFLESVRINVLDAFKNQDYQFDDLVNDLGIKRDASRNPLFDTMFIVQNMGLPDIAIDNLEFNHHHFRYNMSKFDFSLEIGDGDETIPCYLEYSTKLFKQDTAQRMITHYMNILRQIIKDASKTIADIGILTDSEKRRILYEFNSTETELPADKTLVELFNEQVRRTPDNIAVVHEQTELSYCELNAKANRIAGFLQSRGIKPGSVVGIMVERSIDMIAGAIGILKAGAAYLPIDPEYPSHRIQYMLNDSNTELLLTSYELAERVDKGYNTICLENEEIEGLESDEPDIKQSPDNLAYIIYTSGSTGNAKGVMIEHKSIVNTLEWRRKYYGFNHNDAVLQIPSFSFDSSVEDIFTALISGARLVLINQEDRFDLPRLREIFIKHKITNLLVVPSFYRVLLDEVSDSMKNVRIITIAGESFTGSLVNKHFEKLENVRLVNEYGPTENSVCTSFYEFDKDRTEVLIGKPINNTKCYILDRNNRLQPIGVPGELCVSGHGLARGYFNADKLTAEKFIDNPFIPGETMYRTGDMARWLPDGNIEFIGRIDQQVKIRGYRIEIGEIEHHLQKHTNVIEAVVTVNDVDGQKALCAYTVLNANIENKELEEYLSIRLPDYMVPQYFIRMDSLPKTPNGKIDRKMLPEPDMKIELSDLCEAPKNDIEEDFVKVWEEVLGKEIAGINQNFFDIGGNSIRLMEMYSRIEELYPGKLTVSDIFAFPTIAKLAKLISSEKDAPEFANAVEASGVILPEEYFIKENEDIEEKIFKYVLKSETYSALTAISAKNHLKPTDVVMGAFIYLLCEITGVNQLTLHAKGEWGNAICLITTDLSQADSLVKFVELIGQQRIYPQKENICSVERINITGKQHNSVLPLFCINSDLPNEMKDPYDIHVKMTEEADSIKLIYTYDYARLSMASMEKLFSAHTVVLEKILEELNVNKY